MIKAIIFDYGGVMSPQGTIRNICYWYCNKYHLEIEEFTKAIRKNWNLAKVNKITSTNFWEELARNVNLNKQTMRREMITLIKADEKMISLAKGLKKHYSLILLSNHVEDWLEELIQKHKLRKIFSTVITSYSTGRAKPDKEIFRITQETLKLPFEECLFIDDKEKNILAAKELGMKAVLFKNYKSLVNEFKKIGITVD